MTTSPHDGPGRIPKPCTSGGSNGLGEAEIGAVEEIWQYEKDDDRWVFDQPMMNASDANAIRDFLRNGGQIRRLQEAVIVAEQEVVNFLASCGVTATSYRSGRNSYRVAEQRLTRDDLVNLANKERLARQLPPFAIRSVRSASPR